MIRFVSPMLLLLGLIMGNQLFAQSTAVIQEQNGSKVYLKIDPQFLRSDLDSLFYQVNLLNVSSSNISWASALNNGATPGRNVDFFGFDALGLEDLTAAGTLSADSLVLLKDASIAGGLTVNQNVTIHQNLYVDSVRNNPSTDLTLFSTEDFKLDVSADITLDAGDDLYIYTNDRFIVDADDSVFVGVDASGDSDFLVMTETGGTNPFLWLQDPSIVHSDNFTHLFNEDGMRLSVGVDDDDVGIEMHDRSDIMIVYADSMYVPVNRTYFQQIDPDETNEFHPIFGGQEHVFMTDNFAVAHTAIMQHLPAVTDGTSNLLSLYGVDHVSIAVGSAVNAGIEMTETGADGHMVLYADSMALMGEVVVPNQLWVEQLEVNQVIDGQVNSLANHNTDDVVETATNRYYSPAREQVLLDSIADLRDDLDSMMVIIAAIQAQLASPSTPSAPTVDTQAASSLGATVATLNATFTSGGAAVSATGFKYATNSALTGASDVAGNGTTSPFTAALTGLSASQQYWAVGYATNSVGTSYGDTITFTTTAPPASAPALDTQAASSIDHESATLNATFTDGGAAVTATGFKYATNSALSSPSDLAGSGATSPFTGALTGLSASQQYWAVAYATNSVGTSYGDTITFTTSAAPSAFTCGTSTVTYDGHNYATVQIGSQCWFKENLRNDNYNDGAVITGNLTNSDWRTTTSGAQTVYGEGSATINGAPGYDDETVNLSTWGRLYNYYAVETGKLCPTGWEVPTDAEWTVLYNALGSNPGTKAKATSWTGTVTGTDDFGFTALPGGYRDADLPSGGDFHAGSEYGLWWSTTSQVVGAFTYIRTVEMNSYNPSWWRQANPKGAGYSVRCLQAPN